MGLGIIESIKNFFKPPEKGKQVYVLKATPELLKQVPSLVMKRLGMLEAMLIKQQEELERLRKELEKKEGKVEPSEIKVAKELLKQKLKLEKEREENRVRWKIIGVPFPKVKTWDKKFFKEGKFLVGIETEIRDHSKTCNLLLLVDKKSKKVVRKETGLPPELLFEDWWNLEKDIRTGMVRVRIDREGKWYPPEELKSVKKEELTPQLLEAYKNLRRKEIEYLEKIADLEEKIDNLYYKLKMSEKEKEKMRYKIKDLEAANEVLKNSADLSDSALAVALERSKFLALENLKLLLSAQESEVNRVLTERLNEILIEANRKMREKLGKEIPEEVRDYIRDKVRSEFIDALDILESFAPRRMEFIKEVKGKEKEKGG